MLLFISLHPPSISEMAMIVVTSITTSINTKDIKQMFEVICPPMEYLEVGTGTQEEQIALMRVSKEMVM